MSNEETSSRKDIKEEELVFDDEMLVRHLRQSLEQVVANNQRMKVELASLEKQNVNMLNHKYQCLNTAGTPVIPDNKDLVPCLEHVGSKADILVRQLSSLIKSKNGVDKAYEAHCEQAKKVTEAKVMIGFDQYTTMSDKKVEEVIDQMKKAHQETLTKIDKKKKQLLSQQQEYNSWHKDLMNSIVALTKVVQDATERHETLQREEALAFD